MVAVCAGWTPPKTCPDTICVPFYLHPPLTTTRYQWVQLDPDTVRHHQDFENTGNSIAAFVAIDSTLSTAFVSVGIKDGADQPDDLPAVGSRALCDLHRSVRQNFFKNEVPIGRFKQILKKQGYGKHPPTVARSLDHRPGPPARRTLFNALLLPLLSQTHPARQSQWRVSWASECSWLWIETSCSQSSFR